MKKKSITFNNLSKRQLQHLKELYVQQKVECMSHKELKEFVLEIMRIWIVLGFVLGMLI